MRFEVDVPATAAFDAVGFGLNAVDHICVVPHYPERGSKTPVSSFSQTGGGQAATAMIVAARLGLRTKYVGKVGGDSVGAFSLESIRAEGVDVGDVETVEGATNQLAMILVEADSGERTIIWHRPREIATAPEEMTAEKVAVGRVLLVDGHDAPAAARAAAIANEHGIPVVMDAETVKDGTDALVRTTDLLVASSRFPKLYTGEDDPAEALSSLVAAGPTLAVMTLGGRGALAMNRAGETLMSPGYVVNAVDTTGAGDTFHGAFVYGLLAGWSVDETLDFSNAAAALGCTAVGARGGVVGLDQVNALMRTGRRS